MDIKLIALDLDRTLLRADKTLSDYTINVLQRCCERGIKIVFATARPFCNGSPYGVAKFTSQLHTPPHGLITSNGAEVYVENKRIAHLAISINHRDDVLKTLKQSYPHATLFVEIGEEIYGNVPGAKHNDFSKLPEESANMIFMEVQTLDDIVTIQSMLPLMNVEISHGEEGNLALITHKDAGKWQGLNALSNLWQIPHENIMAFGDDHIDIDMLLKSGIGIAVANAMPEVKEEADFICKSNDEDGVAKWLDNYLLIQDEITRYSASTYIFDGFITVPPLADEEIFLVCTKKYENLEKKHVPSYIFAICKGGEKIGNINLRIGYGGGPYNQNLYYGGQIGYDIDEKFRGNGYAVRACRLLISVAKAHRMHTLLITTDEHNEASKRVCEKLNARFIRTVPLPCWHDLFEKDQRYSNIYEWKI